MRRIVVIAAFILGTLSCGGDETPVLEESVTMVTGSYRTVAAGRAEIFIGEFGDQLREDLGSNVDAIEVTITCAEEEVAVWVVEDQPSEPVCRVQLQLVEILSWSPPKAVFKIVWKGDS